MSQERLVKHDENFPCVTGLNEQLAYWRGHLMGAPALLELPTDRPRSVVQSRASAIVPVVLSAQLASGLRSLSNRHGATMFMTLLAAGRCC